MNLNNERHFETSKSDVMQNGIFFTNSDSLEQALKILAENKIDFQLLSSSYALTKTEIYRTVEEIDQDNFTEEQISDMALNCFVDSEQLEEYVESVSDFVYSKIGIHCLK